MEVYRGGHAGDDRGGDRLLLLTVGLVAFQLLSAFSWRAIPASIQGSILAHRFSSTHDQGVEHG
jgi:hypothetical protein